MFRLYGTEFTVYVCVCMCLCISRNSGYWIWMVHFAAYVSNQTHHRHSHLTIRIMTADRRSWYSLRWQARHALQIRVRNGLPENAFRCGGRLFGCLFLGFVLCCVGFGRKHLGSILRLPLQRAAARQRTRRQREILQGATQRGCRTAMRFVGGLASGVFRIDAGIIVTISTTTAGVAAVWRCGWRGRCWWWGRRWRWIRRCGWRWITAAGERDLQIGRIIATLCVAQLCTRRAAARVRGWAARVLLAMVLVADVVVRASPEATRQHIEESNTALWRWARHWRCAAWLCRRHIHEHDALVFHFGVICGGCWRFCDVWMHFSVLRFLTALVCIVQWFFQLVFYTLIDLRFRDDEISVSPGSALVEISAVAESTRLLIWTDRFLRPFVSLASAY